MAVEELGDVFTHFSGGRGVLDAQGTLAAVAALGYALTAAECDALASVVDGVYRGGASFRVRWCALPVRPSPRHRACPLRA